MKNSTIIGISGGSGSGKTSFLKAIRQKFDPAKVCIISQDDYYKPLRDQVVDANGIENFDLPSSIDLDQFVLDITALQSGQEVVRKEYTFNNDLSTAKMITFYPASIIIVEGLFIFHHRPISDLLHYSIIINATDVDKIIRRIKRDQIERNYPLEDVLYRYQHHVLPSYQAYIEPYIKQVDIVINNNHSYANGLDVVSGFLEKLISNT